MMIPADWQRIDLRALRRVTDPMPPQGVGETTVTIPDGRIVVYPFACPCPYDHLALYERPDGALVWVEEAA